MENISYKQTATLVLLIAGLGSLSWKWLQKKAANPQGLPYPPGPKPAPLIGNLLQMPQEKEWMVYREWASTYGDIIYLEVLGQPIIILNSAQTIGDLLERRSAIYSGRPETVFIHQLLQFDWSMALNNGEKWRKQRKTYNPYMSRAAVDQHKDVQLREMRLFLQRLLVNQDFNKQTRQLFGSMMMNICYGNMKDSWIYNAEAAVAILIKACSPGAFLVDLIPSLKYIPSWLPGAGFKRLGEEGKRLADIALDEPMDALKETMEQGIGEPCLARQMLEDRPENEDSKERFQIVRDLMGVSYLAGADTTVTYLDTFLLAMVTHPAAQQKAREELDSVVGSGRLPNFGDRSNLPYLEAVLLETLRWQPATPTALPHYTTDHDEYHGYYIPKGAVVIANAWNVLHNPKDYDEPDRFKPERFLTMKDGKSVINENVRDPRTACFGFGRRICIGRFVAENSLWTVMAGMLCTLIIEPEVGEDGKPNIPKVEWCSGVVSRPIPYKCSIKPRSAQAVEVIQQSE